MSEDFRLDEEFSKQVDHGEVHKTQEDALLPVATYTTVPKLTPRMTKDKHAEYPEGRRVLRLFGLIKTTLKRMTEQGEVEDVKQGTLGFTVSPDVAHFPDFYPANAGARAGKPHPKAGQRDGETQRWAQAVTAFTQYGGRKPETEYEVIQFLTDYPVRLRVGQVGVATEQNPEPDGEPRNIVYSISAVRPE